MVASGKIFKIRQETGLKSISDKLTDYKKEELYENEQDNFTLLVEIKELSLEKNSLKGVFAQDIITHIYHHGEQIPLPMTLETSFVFTIHENQLLLIVLEKKYRANYVANKLSELLFVGVGYISEAKIPSETLKAYHENNPKNTKIIFFGEVDIPNINKLSLYGPDLKDTSLYQNYLSHGEIWYIVVTSQKYGYIVGITGNATITVFNNIDRSDYVTFVIDEIFSLID